MGYLTVTCSRHGPMNFYIMLRHNEKSQFHVNVIITPLNRGLESEQQRTFVQHKKNT